LERGAAVAVAAGVAAAGVEIDPARPSVPEAASGMASPITLGSVTIGLESVTVTVPAPDTGVGTRRARARSRI
jgi:hypothetical protein